MKRERRINRRGRKTVMLLLITAAVIAGVGTTTKAQEPKCGISGCNNERTEGSCYCLVHELGSHYYHNPERFVASGLENKTGNRLGF